MLDDGRTFGVGLSLELDDRPNSRKRLRQADHSRSQIVALPQNFCRLVSYPGRCSS
jgi:hypothetical protein